MNKWHSLTLSLSAFAHSAAAMAQSETADLAAQEPEFDGNVIIVTAQKRDQDWLEVPIALSVQTSEELREERSLNAYDIVRQVPGVTGSNPSEELTQVAIRGVSSEDYGIGSDPTVGVFFDGVYLGRNENTATNFIDLERAEIARGPQGALFGRATPGGAISLVPVSPRSFAELSASAEVGTESFLRSSLIGNVPLSNATFLRGSVIYDVRGDFVDNVALNETLGREESITGRLALRHEFSAVTTLDITGWYESFEGDPWLYRNFTETVEDPADLADLSSRFDFIDQIFSDVPDSELIEARDTWGAILRLSHDFDSGVTLTSLTSALGFDGDYLEDFDGVDLRLFNYGQYTEQSLLSQELRLVSDDTSSLRWFAGALAYTESVDTDVVQSYGDFDLCVFYEFDDEVGCAPAGDGVTDTFIFARGDNDGFAVYAEAEFDLAERLTLTAGLRYTHDDKTLLINAPRPGGFLPADDVGYTVPTEGVDVVRSKTFTSWQTRIALMFQASNAMSIYGLFSEGEKPGGFDTFDAFSPAFNAEKVETYEVGMKGRISGGQFTYSIAAYKTDYSDLQVLVADGPRDIVRNAATADSMGLEAEGVYRGEGFEIGLRGALSDAEFDAFADPINGFDFSGNRLPYTPKWSVGVTLGLEEELSPEWTLFARGDFDKQGQQFLTPANDEFASNQPYERIDFRFGVRREKGIEVFVFGQNVTGADYVAFADITDYNMNFGGFLAQFSRPALFGLGISFQR